MPSLGTIFRGRAPSGGGGPGAFPGFSNASPSSLGSLSAGAQNLASRADHVHAHGALTDPTFHAAATQATAGFLSAADKTALDGLDALGLRTAAVQFRSGSADPSIAPGVIAAQPALYIRTTAGVSTLWVKTGAADTAWTQVALLSGAAFTGAISAPSATMTGNVQAARFLGDAGTNAAPTFSFTADDNHGVYAEAADTMGFAVGGTRVFRVRSADVATIGTQLDVGRQLRLSGDTPSAALAANQDNLDPGAATGVWLLDVQAAIQITGIAGGADNRVMPVINIGVQAATFVHESPSSLAANRLALPGGSSVQLAAGAFGWLIYHSAAQRWRLLV